LIGSRRTLPRADIMKKLPHLSKENQQLFAAYCGAILISFFGNQNAYDDTDILAGSMIFVQLNLLYLYFIWKQQQKRASDRRMDWKSNAFFLTYLQPCT
jgi:hypothetical protein